MSNQHVTTAIRRHLTEQGYRHDLDEDGDIWLRMDGMGYLIRVQADDPLFYQIHQPVRIGDEDRLLRRRLREFALEVSRRVKVVKCWVREDDLIIFCVEGFHPEVEDFLTCLERYRSVLTSAMHTLRDLAEQFEAAAGAPVH